MVKLLINRRMEWKETAPETDGITEPSLSRENLGKRYGPGYTDQNEGHILGNMGGLAKVQKLEECIWGIQLARAGVSGGNW